MKNKPQYQYGDAMWAAAPRPYAWPDDDRTPTSKDLDIIFYTSGDSSVGIQGETWEVRLPEMLLDYTMRDVRDWMAALAAIFSHYADFHVYAITAKEAAANGDYL